MEVIENARKRLEELKAEQQKLQSFIATYEELEGALKPNPSHPQPTRIVLIAAGGKKNSGTSPSKIIEAAKQIIREHGSPMTRSELVESIENKGIYVGGVDKNKNMGTILWRSNEFHNVEGEGYWPKGDEKWKGL